MAITTYSELQTALTNALKRDPGNWDDLIDLAEARIRRGLRVSSLEQRSTLSTVAGTNYYSLPSDFREMRSIRLDTDPKTTLEFASPEEIDAKYAGSETSKPLLWTIEGDELRLAPTPDTVYTVAITYHQELPGLSDSQTTNWLLTNHPDAYLYGVLTEAATYLMDETGKARWEPLFQNAMGQAVREDMRRKYPGSALRMRPRSFA